MHPGSAPSFNRGSSSKALRPLTKRAPSAWWALATVLSGCHSPPQRTSISQMSKWAQSEGATHPRPHGGEVCLTAKCLKGPPERCWVGRLILRNHSPAGTPAFLGELGR